eukprot:GHVQ01032174.1.p1 GENE.GHVQ01032174.1~~GHVQ01032174.1.p1  ORF type:complete len:307 (-),score=5.61 GHVQ01032174.1:587-1507(-)
MEKGLYLKLQKTDIFPAEMPLLGHLVSVSGYRPDPQRIEGLKNAREPRNSKELRSFLAAASYVREFVPNYSELTQTFRVLTKKNAKWEWTSEQSYKYHYLLQQLCDQTYLTGPTTDGPFVLIADASQYSVGAGLLQYQNAELRVIGFYSKGLTTTEQKWDTREREAYAIKWALARTRDMVKGHKIYVLTDHSSLQWAKDAPQCKVQRWLWYMQQFDLEILHIAGHLNPLADWLSRCNTFDDDCDKDLENIVVPTYSITPVAQSMQLPGTKQLKEAYQNVPLSEQRLCYTGLDDLLYGIKAQELYVP